MSPYHDPQLEVTENWKFSYLSHNVYFVKKILTPRTPHHEYIFVCGIPLSISQSNISGLKHENTKEGNPVVSPKNNPGWEGLTLVLLNCLLLLVIHSKLELLMQFSASNDEKYLYRNIFI